MDTEVDEVDADKHEEELPPPRAIVAHELVLLLMLRLCLVVARPCWRTHLLLLHLAGSTIPNAEAEFNKRRTPAA